MLKKMRKIHLWISLIACLFIFIESASGLMLTHRWMMGVTSGHNHSHSHSEGHNHSSDHQQLTMMNAVAKASNTKAFSMSDISVAMDHGDTYMVKLKDDVGTSIVINPQGDIISISASPTAKFVRDLHVGQIGDTDVSWALDIAALSILVLTGTGLVLSIYMIRPKARSKNRLVQA